MKKQKLFNILILGLFFTIGLVYSAKVFVVNTKTSADTVMTSTNGESKENAEENVKEASHFLFLQEKVRYQLKPVVAIISKINTDIEASLPETYLQLSTPPPDFA